MGNRAWQSWKFEEMSQVLKDGDLVQVIIPRTAHDYPPEYTYVVLQFSYGPGVVRVRHAPRGARGKPIIISLQSGYGHIPIFLENWEAMPDEAKQFLGIRPEWFKP